MQQGQSLTNLLRRSSPFCGSKNLERATTNCSLCQSSLRRSTPSERHRPVVPERSASEILVTKVLLGTFGCLPACDTYFRAGFKNAGFLYSSVNAHFLERLFHFANDNLGV